MNTIRHDWKERCSAWILVFAMIFGMFPQQAWATDAGFVDGGVSLSKSNNVITASLVPAPSFNGTAISDGTWSWEKDNTPISGENDSTYTVTPLTNNETEVKETYKAIYTYSYEDGEDARVLQTKTIENSIEVTHPAITPPATVKDFQVSVSPSTLKEGETATLKGELVYSDDTTEDVTGSVTFSSGAPSTFSVSGSTLTAVNAGSAQLIAVYTGNIAMDSSISKIKQVSVTVTSSDTDKPEEPEPEPEPEPAPELSITGMSFSSSLNGDNKISTSTVLSVNSAKTDIITVNLTASGGTPAENTSFAESQLQYVKWAISPATSVATMTVVSTGASGKQQLIAVNPGQATVTASYEDAVSGKTLSEKFTVTVQGATLDNTPSPMLTYSTMEEEDAITLTKYGTVSINAWKPRNTNMVSVINNEDNTSGLLQTYGEPGVVTIDIITSEGTISFDVVIEEAIADDIIPVDGVNILNVLKFETILEDFLARSKDVYPDETLKSIQSLEVSPAQGTLYVGYQSEDNTGAGVATSASYSLTTYPRIGDVVFVPNQDYTGEIAIIKYTGLTDQDRTFYGEIHVTLAPIKDVVTDTAAKEPVKLSSYSLSQVAANSGKSIRYVEFSIPDANRAVMYYDYKSADNFHHQMVAGEQIAQGDIDKITVIPASGFSGNLDIPYVITCTDGTTLIGAITVKVAGYGPEGPIVYNTVAGEYVTFITEDFHKNVQAITGYSMNYITFSLPDPSKGTLYELYFTDTNYRKLVTTDTAYFASARTPQISEVSFVPATGFSGPCDIDFVGYDMLGNSYAGTIEVNVSSQSVGDIHYICSEGSYIPFYEGDFNQYSREITGQNLEYISFPTLPPSSQGSLRLGQSSYETYVGMAVTQDTPYYLKGTPLLSQVSFSATKGYTGLVNIPFEGKAVNGQVFAGVVSVVVTNQNLVKIPYNATHYNPAKFDADHFDHYSQERTESDLDYVRFELPLETVGTLYYNYKSDSNYGSLVNATTDYYADKSHYLDSVTFVPHRDFQGTAQINFTAWGKNGASFSGMITVYVADGGDPLSYYMYTGDYIYLNVNAIQDFCLDETGSSLNSIIISLPTTAQGRLYQNYDESNTTHTAASSTTRYFKAQTPYISNLAFVSTSGYVGTVSLNFTATAVDGSTCSGTIYIIVRPSEANASIYHYTSFAPILLDESKFNEVWGGEAVEYIEIHNIPTATQGKLYYENNLSSFATTSMKYYSLDHDEGPYISKMVYAPRAGFSGTMIISYTATTEAGRTFTGDIQVVVNNNQPSLYFTDMGSYSWATASADYLCMTSVTTGTGGTNFSPEKSITRGDFALMLVNAFRFSGTNATQFSDVASDIYYGPAVLTLRALGITSGFDGNVFRPTANISRQDAMVMLNKAMEVAKKNVPIASTGVLSKYQDSSTVYSYATQSMANMVNSGMVSGDSNGKLNPQNPITRAEMAVVLHQAMTF